MGIEKTSGTSLLLSCIAVLLSPLCLKSQSAVFNWATDGYSACSGGGTYSNIDGSGINLTVSGLNKDCVSFGSCGCMNSVSGCVQSTADNGIPPGMVYNYTFSFNAPVDVHFRMAELDQANGGSGHYDEVTLSGSPVFSNPNQTTFSGSTVFPGNNSSASIEVDYTCVSSFTIQHGSGLASTNQPAILHIFDLTLNSCGPLPVEMNAWEVSKVGTDAQLQWETTQESQLARFDLQHSLDGSNWESLAEIPARNQNEATTYQWKHAYPGEGLHHYRITALDLDGSQSQWPVRTLSMEQLTRIADVPELQVYPNPAREAAMVDFGKLPIQSVRLYNSAGQEIPVRTEPVGDSQVKLYFADLPKGIYLVEARGAAVRRAMYLQIR